MTFTPDEIAAAEMLLCKAHRLPEAYADEAESCARAVLREAGEDGADKIWCEALICTGLSPEQCNAVTAYVVERRAPKGAPPVSGHRIVGEWPDEALPAFSFESGYEYAASVGARKACTLEPPDPTGWEEHAFERFDYHEAVVWRRPMAPRGAPDA